ncbi:hypothetical protein BC628DRAFT_271154 [Trametes gibbosa]|nr:hypothetical protein BC628DRAFT_271154 [Trametes gibbosa]
MKTSAEKAASRAERCNRQIAREQDIARVRTTRNVWDFGKWRTRVFRASRWRSFCLHLFPASIPRQVERLEAVNAVCDLFEPSFPANGDRPEKGTVHPSDGTIPLSTKRGGCQSVQPVRRANAAPVFSRCLRNLFWSVSTITFKLARINQ